MKSLKRTLLLIAAGVSSFVAATPAQAITIDPDRFFAYVYQPHNRFKITLSHLPCPVSKFYFGYAEQIPPNGTKPWPSCWRTATDNPSLIAVCSIVEGKIAYCQFIDKSYFKEVSSLPAAAFK